MKVLNLIQCANLGGMEQASLRLMRELTKQGNSVRMLSLNPVGQLGPLLEEAGIPVEGLPYRGKGGWRSIGLLRRKLRTIQADGLIMTGHNLLASLALGSFCKGRRVLAVHFHHSGVKPTWNWQLIYRVACQRFSAITFPCDFIRKEAEAIFPPVARLAYTIRNPMEIPPLATASEKAKARQKLNFPLGRPIIGNAGWLIPRKRFDIFLRVAHVVLASRPDTVFAIAGDGPERESLQNLASELGISASIRWLGWQQDMNVFYQALDVLLFNSDWDTSPCAPQEAMTYGVPVVSSLLHGGLSETLNSDRVGFLLTNHDIERLATLVLRLLNRPAEAAEIGLAGRGRIEEVSRPRPIVDWHAQALSGRLRSHHLQRDEATSGKQGKVAVLFNRIGPYHFARLRAAGKVLNVTSIEIYKSDKVYGWDLVPGADGFNRVTLFEKDLQPTTSLVTRLREALNDCRPTVVAIPGWSDPVAFSAMKWCITNHVPAIVMSESTEWDERRSGWKEWLKGRLIGLCESALAGGGPHADYLTRLGMSRERVFLGYDAVDNDYFATKADEVRKDKLGARNRLGLPENFFLASARFVEKKNLLRLLRAYAGYRKAAEGKGTGGEVAKPWDLVLLGDGPLRPSILGLRSSLGLDAVIHLPGFKQYGELPAYYALAKVFIHASTTEQWGLVVNEAMASGLPVLVSKRCGCAIDLVHEGSNGFTFDPYQTDEMVGLMLKVSGERFPLVEFGSASSQIISKWGPARFAEGMSQAVRTAVGVPLRETGMADKVILNLLLAR